MNAHTKILPRLSALALCVMSACVLPACGGGSAGGIVATSPPPPPPPPPPPSGFCPEPLTADCVVNLPANRGFGLTGRQSDYALIKRGEGELDLTGDSRFSGGISVEEGSLRLTSILQANITVQTAGSLSLGGQFTGNVVNHGAVGFGGLWCSEPCFVAPTAHIQGDYRQSASGTLLATLYPYDDNEFALLITGRADIEGGTLQLNGFYEGWGPYYLVLPAAPHSQHILHADGGVFGQFDNWTSPGLFITGSLRYLSNDIYFDATSISAQRAMAAAGFNDAVTVGTASNFDDALGAAGALMALPGTALTTTQDQFLRSAASIQRIRDYDEAATTFDSLSGHGHVAAVDTLLQQAVGSGARSSMHARDLQPGSRNAAWSSQPTLVSTGTGTFKQARTSGHDQWLSDRLLLGSSFGWTQGNLQFDRSGGSARSQSPQWNLYLHRRGDNGAYATGDVGYGRHQLSLDRRIDLGGEMHVARSERHLDVTHAYAEAGREVPLGKGRLTPFAALGYAALRSDGFVEQGDTGFEFMAGPSLHQRLSSDVGVRYARHWRWGGRQWMQLDLGAGYQHLLGASDDMRAAFTGTPWLGFDVNGLPLGRGNGWLEMNLTGGSSDRWSWLLSYDNRASNQTVSLGVEVGF